MAHPPYEGASALQVLSPCDLPFDNSRVVSSNCFTNSKERGARATHVHPAPQLTKAHDNELRSLNCTSVPNMVAIGQRVSELEGFRLKNGIVPCGHNFDPSGSSLRWHIRHTRVHLPCKFWVPATPPSKILSSSCCFFSQKRKFPNFDPPKLLDPPNFHNCERPCYPAPLYQIWCP